MTTTAETGQAGERAATEHLRREGYDIRALNWRQGRYELDIVALKEGEVQFDLAAAEAFPDGTIRVELIENALEYNW